MARSSALVTLAVTAAALSAIFGADLLTRSGTVALDAVRNGLELIDINAESRDARSWGKMDRQKSKVAGQQSIAKFFKAAK
jgi:hypothetical protein